MTLSKCSRPLIDSCSAGSVCEPYRWRDAARYKVSLTSVDLPEPDTPVTQVSKPTGRSKLTFFRLLPVAPASRAVRGAGGGVAGVCRWCGGLGRCVCRGGRGGAGCVVVLGLTLWSV